MPCVFFSMCLAAVSIGGPAPAFGGACGPTTLNQNGSFEIDPLLSRNCSSDLGGNAVSSHFRAFRLPADGFEVCAIRVGIAAATSASGTQPLDVHLYSEDTPPFPGDTRTLIGSTRFQLADQSAGLISVPVVGVLGSGAELVVEVATSDRADNLLWLGANDAADLRPSFFAAPACDVDLPVETSTLSTNQVSLVLTVIGGPPGFSLLFADGFESSDLAQWSVALP